MFFRKQNSYKIIKSALTLIVFCFLFILNQTLNTSICWAQCGANTPVFNVNLATSSNRTWISADTARNDTCCGATAPDKCVKFIVTLPAGAMGIVFDVYSGAIPPGALYYKVGCGPHVHVGTNICLSSQGPHVLTFCKPGNNKNRYSITAYPFPDISDAITVNDGCNGLIHCTDYALPTIQWNSIYPGAIGAYNNYLSCSTACDSPRVNAKPGYPPYVDFMVCGQPVGGCSTDTICDTVRVYFKSTLKAVIQPDTPTICYGAITTTLTANGTGGTPPYRFVWSTTDTTTLLNADTGIYILTVYDTSKCPPAYDTVTVTAFSNPITANAGPDLLSCFNSVNISGAVTGTTTGKWLGGNGSFSPSRTSLNVTYYPTAAELSSGTVILKLTTTGNGTCPPDTDEVRLRFRKFTDTVRSIINQVSCFGALNGSILLQPTSHHAPFSYAWSNAATTAGINSLDTGVYMVTVTDSGGCTWTDTFQINQPSKLNTSLAVKMLNCFGSNDGEINLTPSGGILPYTYLWSNNSTTQDINSLAAAKYIVTVTDSHGCIKRDSVIITQPPKLVATHNLIHVNCFGQTNGSIDLTVTGGVLPYGYNWSNSSITQDIGSLLADTFSVIVADSHGCKIYDTAIITQPARLSKSHTITNLFCFGDQNGQVDLSINGGVAPFSYVWSNASTTQDINSLSAGTYIVTVTDSHGCIILDTAIVTQPPRLMKSHTSIMVSCNGGSNGEIDLTVNGGIQPYAYYWSNTAVTQDLKGLSAGTYMVTITDSNFCKIYDTVVITQPAKLAMTAVVRNVSCYSGSNGGINLNVTGGTMPYKYKWSNNDTNSSPANFKSGQYSVVVTDAKGCVIADTFFITEPTALFIIGKLKNVCKLGNNGEIDITVGGGRLPYSYSWSNGAKTQDLKNLIKGSYIITLTDSGGCRLLDTFVLQESAMPIAIGLFPTHVRCFGESSGSIVAQTSGGIPHLYLRWSNGDTTNIITGLAAGNYKLVITDAIGCMDSATTAINQPSALTNSATISNVSCFSKNDGSITLQVFGGTPPYHCNWETSDTGLRLTSKPAGMYSAIISDSKGCVLNYNGTIKEPPGLNVSYTTRNANCFGSSDGNIQVTVNGGTPPYRYSWSTGHTVNILNNLKAGNYILTITESNNCITRDSISISQPEQLQLQYTKVDEKCRGDADGSINITVTGGTKPYSFLWNMNSRTEDIYNLGEGMYNVMVTDSHGCILYSENINITAFSVPEPSIQPSDNFTACVDELVNIWVAEDFASYLWNTGETTKSISVSSKGYFYAHVTDFNGCKGQTKALRIDRLDPSEFIDLKDEYRFCPDNGPITISAGPESNGHYLWSPSGETTRSITVYEGGEYYLMYDTMGCITGDTTFVREACPPIVLVPNVFTPNNNGINDVFKISAMYVDELHYVIFDRWGTIIFKGNNVDATWDGTFNGQTVLMDAYGYVVFYNSIVWGDNVLYGTVTVLR